MKLHSEQGSAMRVSPCSRCSRVPSRRNAMEKKNIRARDALSILSFYTCDSAKKSEKSNMNSQMPFEEKPDGPTTMRRQKEGVAPSGVSSRRQEQSLCLGIE